jgi:hypothetical protein
MITKFQPPSQNYERIEKVRRVIWRYVAVFIFISSGYEPCAV